MNKFTKMAVVAAGVALVAQGVQAASFTANDLYLGFTSSSATSDLIIDLGQASTLTGAGITTVDLSSDLAGLTAFNTTFSSSANGVTMAVVGGTSTFGAAGVFTTALRAGGAGNNTVAGSDYTSLAHASGNMSGGAAAISGMAPNLPSAGGAPFVDSTKGYSSKVDLTTSANSFAGKTGATPASTIGASGIIYEDLWAATQNASTGAYAYKGYFTFDYNNDTLTFTSANAVPEPATYGLFAGAGLLALSLRRQFRRKTA